jgi:hypothetical protein
VTCQNRNEKTSLTAKCGDPPTTMGKSWLLDDPPIRRFGSYSTQRLGYNIYIYVYVHVYIYVRIYIYIHMYEYIYTHMYVYIYIYIIFKYIYIMDILYMCININIYIYMYRYKTLVSMHFRNLPKICTRYSSVACSSDPPGHELSGQNLVHGRRLETLELDGIGE